WLLAAGALRGWAVVLLWACAEAVVSSSPALLRAIRVSRCFIVRLPRGTGVSMEEGRILPRLAVERTPCLSGGVNALHRHRVVQRHAPAVHGDDLARDVAGGVAGQPGHHVGHFLGLAQALQGRAAEDLAARVFA